MSSSSVALRRSGKRQWALKPHDLAVALKLVVQRGAWLPYATLAKQLRLSAFEAHAAVQRLMVARLAVERDGSVHPVMAALRGEVTIGFPTAYAVPPLRDMVLFSEDMPPVWPHPEGPARGPTLLPLYEKLPLAARDDAAFYELLALFDALRMGQAREREIASRLLEERLK